MRKACEILGVVPMTLRRWEKAGKIQCIRTPSGQRRYPRSEILRLLGENQ
ncbi:MerR family DNA-binding transcriptional regulator, partial [Desulfotomaculum copahuensis]